MAYDDRETGLTVEDRGSKLGLPQNQDAEANVHRITANDGGMVLPVDERQGLTHQLQNVR